MTILDSVGTLAHAATEETHRPLRARMAGFLVAVAVLDCVALFVASLVGWMLRILSNDIFGASLGGEVSATRVLVFVSIWMAALIAHRAYSHEVFAAGYGEYAVVVRASLWAVGGIGFYAYLVKDYVPRGFLFYTFVCGLTLLLIVRFMARNLLSAMRRRGHLLHRAVLVGSPTAVSELLHVFRREDWTGYGVLGVCVPEGSHESWQHDIPVLGEIGEVAQVILREGADTVVVAGGSYSSASDLRRVGWALEGLTADLLVAPTLTDIAGPRISVRNAAGLPLMRVAQPALNRARGPVKRAFDLVIASSMLVVLSPVLAVIALAIKSHDRGPVLYRQTRVGALGETFSILKFRSMVRDADSVRAELEHANEHDGVLFKIKDDPRITPVGRVIRRFSLDELPQLINVLRGDMSLVGPRPALPAEVERYGDDVRRRLLVQPGLTGLWQVSGRSDLSWEDSVRLDLYYVDNWSMIGDLAILARTAKAVLARRGAY